MNAPQRPNPVDAQRLARLRDEDARHHVHAWGNHHVLKSQGPKMIVRGQGAHIWDADGHRLIDGVAGLWCVNVGHGRAEIAEAMARQATALAFYSSFGNLTNPAAAELAARLVPYAPKGLSRVFFSTSGSDANETAIRTVQRYFAIQGKTTKRFILAREDAYHGSTYLTASLSGRAFFPGWDAEERLIHRLSTPYAYRRPDGMSVEAYADSLVREAEETILRLGPENVACYIAEPIMGRGVMTAPAGVHRRTREICAKYGVLYISDEVVTGFGRLGHLYASEPVFELTPDILVSAKGLSSGYAPLAATYVSDAIFDVLSQPGEIYYHGFTYSGHPVACAAGLANLDILERENITALVQKNGAAFKRAIEGLLDLDIVGDVRGSHYMIGIEFVADKASKRRFADDVRVSERISRKAYAKGLVARAVMPECILLSPTLVMSEADIAESAAILRASIRETMDEVKREGLWR
ncbi:MAG: aminotransferase class III-fold pyridoxal phosphate-dependent enzyme [Alphaproteobacteria bacterium]|nr:aminotransferase class III-fold pyridoxal phosphate-dependent enzyme [Alphaproteobacteria bacterium]